MEIDANITKYDDNSRDFLSKLEQLSSIVTLKLLTEVNDHNNSSLSLKYIWEPTVLDKNNLQRRKFKTIREEYEVFFPLELTYSDYSRRILSIVADAIGQRVIDISIATPDIKSISVKNPHSLLKYILRKEETDSFKIKSERSILCSKLNLGGNFSKLIDAAEFLYDLESSLYTNECEDFGKLNHNTKLFQYAKDIIESFGPSTLEKLFLEQVENLQEQYFEHAKFKDRRMQHFNWEYGISSNYHTSNLHVEQPVGDYAKGNGASDHFSQLLPIAQYKSMSPSRLLQETDLLQTILMDIMSPNEISHTLLITRLLGTSNDIDSLIVTTSESQQYAEAHRLQTLKSLMRSAVAADKKSEYNLKTAQFHCGYGVQRLDVLESLCSRIDRLCDSLAVAEIELCDNKIFVGVESAASCHEATISLLRFKDEIKECTKYFSWLTSSLNSTLVTTEYILHSKHSDNKTIFSLIFSSKNDSIFRYICENWLSSQRAMVLNHHFRTGVIWTNVLGLKAGT